MKSTAWMPTLGVVAVVVAALFGGRSAIAQDPPNILMIYVDDLAYRGLGVVGHNFVETPNLDAIGNSGAVFTNSFVTTPMCSPGRASMLTGQYSATNGVYYNDQSNGVSDNDLPTYQKELQTAGYRTGWVGKWHMDHFLHAREGFDYWASFHGQGNHYENEMGILEDGVFRVEHTNQDNVGWTKTSLTNYAIDFLQDYGTGGSRTEPFALTLSFKAVHAPHGDEYTESGGDYRSESTVRPENATAAYGGFDINTEKPVYAANGSPLAAPSNTAGDSTQISQMQMMKDIDAEVGRVMATLDQQGLADDTLIIFTSDNGFFWGEHGLGDKRRPYEESVRVPLLISGPGVAPGLTPDGMVANIDLAPTILTTAGVPVPDSMQGIALNEVLSGASTHTRDELFFEYEREYKYEWAPTWDAVRTDSHYYVTYTDFGEQYDELYDLVNDPGQMNNLLIGAESGLPETEQLLADMRSRLDVIRDEATFGVNGFERSVYDLGTIDFAVTEAGDVTSSTSTSTRVGADGSGRSAVIAFEVPVLEEGLTLERAFVSFFLEGHQGDTSSITGDLWAIGITDDATPLAEYLESDDELAQADRADNLKLQDGVLDGDNHNGRNFSDEAAAELLADYLIAFYDESPGYSGGSYLQVRLNPDENLGNGSIGWNVYTTENLQSGEPFYFRFPSLVFETTGEAIDILYGDLDLDGVFTANDVALFIQNWRADTSSLSTSEKAQLGDLNTDGVTDYLDWALMREIFSAAGLNASALIPASVPEPSAAACLGLVGVGVGLHRSRPSEGNGSGDTTNGERR